MTQRLTLVTLGCADLDRSRAFYAAFGWTPAVESEEDGAREVRLPARATAKPRGPRSAGLAAA